MYKLIILATCHMLVRLVAEARYFKLKGLIIIIVCHQNYRTNNVPSIERQTDVIIIMLLCKLVYQTRSWCCMIAIFDKGYIYL